MGMTLAEILSNETVRQREFPVARQLIYLAHASVCALPRRVSDAITAYASQCVSGYQEDLLPPEFIPQTRALAALHQKLAAAGVIASLRADRAGRRYLRFSPHFYNTDEELRRALELL
jgi:selenocysteine lyase/cysteine desulfurase